MSKIHHGVPYSPMQAYSRELESVSNFCFDVAKLNLAWLAEPRIDSQGASALLGNPIAASIDEYMDTETRTMLQGSPLIFINYWKGLNKQGVPALTKGWPENTNAIMEIRAQDAHERLYGLPPMSNVVFASFGRH